MMALSQGIQNLIMLHTTSLGEKMLHNAHRNQFVLLNSQLCQSLGFGLFSMCDAQFETFCKYSDRTFCCEPGCCLVHCLVTVFRVESVDAHIFMCDAYLYLLCLCLTNRRSAAVLQHHRIISSAGNTNHLKVI